MHSIFRSQADDFFRPIYPENLLLFWHHHHLPCLILLVFFCVFLQMYVFTLFYCSFWLPARLKTHQSTAYSTRALICSILSFCFRSLSCLASQSLKLILIIPASLVLSSVTPDLSFALSGTHSFALSPHWVPADWPNQMAISLYLLLWINNHSFCLTSKTSAPLDIEHSPFFVFLNFVLCSLPPSCQVVTHTPKCTHTLFAA